MVTLQISGLELRVKPSAIATALLITGGFAAVLNKLFKFRPLTAVAGGVLVTQIHYFSELWHQLGHARAAEMTGFPMKGVTLVGPIGKSVYPSNEGLLPAPTHIQRAVGGPIFSILLTLVSGLLALATRPLGGLPLFLATFTFLDNLLVFVIGAMLPLGFTDGSTILAWRDQWRGGPRVTVD